MWEGQGIVKSARKLIGSTNPLEAEPGTIRGDFAVQTGRNVVHGSDSPENGKREAGAMRRVESSVLYVLTMLRRHWSLAASYAVVDRHACCNVEALPVAIPDILLHPHADGHGIRSTLLRGAYCSSCSALVWREQSGRLATCVGTMVAGITTSAKHSTYLSYQGEGRLWLLT